MARKVFYSFHYTPDNWRVSQVRQMGAVEGSRLLSSNGWEEVKKGGNAAIQKWIDDELKGCSCTVVLTGASTAGRDWVDYEIKKSWNDGKGLLGVYIHNLNDKSDKQSTKGKNPFSEFKVGQNSLNSIVKMYDSPFVTGPYVYGYIKENLADWVEEAIKIRKNYTDLIK